MKTIDITTTQKVTIQYELASVRDRGLAWLLDMVIMGAGGFFLFLFLQGIIRDEDYALFFGFIPVFLFYIPVSEIFMDGQTLGKKALALRVVKVSGQEPSIGDYLTRWIFRSVDITGSLGAAAAILIGSSDKNQRIGDMLANTTVVKLVPSLNLGLQDLLSIHNKENYKPTYPQIQQFDEEQMLVIKKVVDRASKFKNYAHREIVYDLTASICNRLSITKGHEENIDFLKTLIRDYIVLTR